MCQGFCCTRGGDTDVGKLLNFFQDHLGNTGTECPPFFDTGHVPDMKGNPVVGRCEIDSRFNHPLWEIIGLPDLFNLCLSHFYYLHGLSGDNVKHNFLCLFPVTGIGDRDHDLVPEKGMIFGIVVDMGSDDLPVA